MNIKEMQINVLLAQAQQSQVQALLCGIENAALVVSGLEPTASNLQEIKSNMIEASDQIRAAANLSNILV